MLIGGVLEWVLGNSFAAVVFCTFGGFWIPYGGTLVPPFAAYSSYAPRNEPEATGLATQSFSASLGDSAAEQLQIALAGSDPRVLTVFIGTYLSYLSHLCHKNKCGLCCDLSEFVCYLCTPHRRILGPRG